MIETFFFPTCSSPIWDCLETEFRVSLKYKTKFQPEIWKENLKACPSGDLPFNYPYTLLVLRMLYNAAWNPGRDAQSQSPPYLSEYIYQPPYLPYQLGTSWTPNPKIQNGPETENLSSYLQSDISG